MIPFVVHFIFDKKDFSVVKSYICSCNICRKIKYSKDGGDNKMHDLLKSMSRERMGKPLDVFL